MSEAPDKPAILAAPESASGFRHWMARNAWRLVLLFGGVLLPLAGFVALADEVHEFESFHFDAPLLWQMHGLHSPLLDRFFVLISKLGYEWFLIPADVLIIGALLGYRRWREATFVAVSFVGSALLNMGSKHFFQRQRPSLWESIVPESTFSFPSGHAMGSMTLAVTLVLLTWNTRWRWPVLLLAPAFSLLVSVSRVYLGVHYPSDILAGWCAALVWVVGCYLVMFSRRHPWRRHGPPPAKASEASSQGD
nr:phosphatase PAP2 family protein [Stenotrophomonas geniculata]